MCLNVAISSASLARSNSRLAESYRNSWKMVGTVRCGQAYCVKKQAHFVSG